jgi:hypothetical protein
MIPKDALNKIRRATIYSLKNTISGFSFFDKDEALLYKIGCTTHTMKKKETVLLAENEVIVGVVAKLHPDYKSKYTDF